MGKQLSPRENIEKSLKYALKSIQQMLAVVKNQAECIEILEQRVAALENKDVEEDIINLDVCPECRCKHCEC